MICRVKTPAKINLSLDIVGKRDDGYHLLETVMQSIAIYDTISVKILDKSTDFDGAYQIKITADNPTFPCDMRNTCYKAAMKFALIYEEKLSHRINKKENVNNLLKDKQITIRIDKKIPQSAGLAGGSADAAAVIIALNNLLDNPFSYEDCLTIGVQIGADVPFCLTGGTILCKGIGEVLEPIDAFNTMHVVLVKPNFGLSTPWVFSKIDIKNLGARPHSSSVIAAVIENDIEKLSIHTANVLETVSIKERPVLQQIKESLNQHGAKMSMMSGSGPTVFGIFESKEAAGNAVINLRKNKDYGRFYIASTTTINHGPQVIMMQK